MLILSADWLSTMAERPEDLNLPNAVIARIIKEAVSKPQYCMILLNYYMTPGNKSPGAES